MKRWQNPTLRHRCPCSSCCPTWKTTARCRLDGVKLAVMEVMGLELDEPKLSAFAGSLNAVDFPVQLLVQSAPTSADNPPQTTWRRIPARGPAPDQTKEAAESLGRLLTTLETREGILDRRFYAVCDHSRVRRTAGAAGAGRISASSPSPANSLKLLLLACALGGSPRERDEDAELEVEVNRRDIRIGSKPGALPAPGQVAQVAGAWLPAGADGRRRAHGPVGPPGRHPGGAGCPHPGVAEGPFRVGPEPFLQTRPQYVAGSRDRVGGRFPPAGTRCSGAGKGCSTHRCRSHCTPTTRTR